MDRLIVVSADAHAGTEVESYRPYLDPAYHPLLDELAQEDMIQRQFMMGQAPSGDGGGDAGVGDQQGGLAGAWDMRRRLAEMDREGVAAEIVLPGVPTTKVPFFGAENQPHPPDVRLAGTRAYHRWINDAIEPGRGRLFPVADPGPCHDMAATVDELRWVADHGFVGVAVPGYTGDPTLPPLHNDHFEPFYAACADLGLVLVMHAGYGLEQGAYGKMLEATKDILARPDLTDEQKRAEMQRHPFFSTRAVRYRLAFWQILLGGVFDRHPSLRLAFTELGADWITTVLELMDGRHAQGDTPLSKRPSEYWASNCGVVASSIRRIEVDEREQVGLDRIMFGTDFPHPEGTWPNTRDWMRAAFSGVPEADVRKIVGENAIGFFGLDRAPLAEVASRIGPTVEEVIAGDPVDAPTLASFDARGSFSLPARPVDREDLATALDDEVRGFAGV
ncbi:MAG: amidohydrolase [Actinobacteria bacterium]|nr:amidohydrolase [Actinomycetota bacterium]